MHAYRYCCNFHTEFRIPADRLPIVMNNNRYAPDIRVLDCTEVDDNFNARFDTKYKTYRYLINTAAQPSIYRRNYEWQIGKPLDIDAMNEAARHIVGEHDFASFMTSGTDVASTVRNVFSLKVAEIGDDMTELLITADGYLYNMVRIITGTLVSVGDGTVSADSVANIVAACNRAVAGPTAPPQGLYLYDVVY